MGFIISIVIIVIVVYNHRSSRSKRKTTFDQSLISNNVCFKGNYNQNRSLVDSLSISVRVVAGTYMHIGQSKSAFTSIMNL